MRDLAPETLRPREKLRRWWKEKKHEYRKRQKERAAAREKRKIDREYRRMMKK